MQSVKGQQMIKSISPIYKSLGIEESVYEAVGSEFDSVNNIIDDIMLQLFPQTATWGLKYWEQRLGFETNLNEDIDMRRKKVIVKMQTRWPITPKAMATIINTFTDANVQIFENVAPYIFEVDLISQKGFPNDLENVYKTVKRIKPSHLGVKYKLISKTNMNLYYAATTISGEKVRVYPWQPRKIQSSGNIDVAMSSARDIEKVSIYPKKEAK